MEGYLVASVTLISSARTIIAKSHTHTQLCIWPTGHNDEVNVGSSVITSLPLWYGMSIVG